MSRTRARHDHDGNLRGRVPDRLYHQLCIRDGVRHDPRMRDVLAAVVAFANGEPARPWWHYSRLRKVAEARVRQRGGPPPRR